MADSRMTLHEHEWYYGELKYTARRAEPESVYGVIEPQAFKESAAVNEILYLVQREGELASELLVEKENSKTWKEEAEKWQQKAFRRVEPERLTEERAEYRKRLLDYLAHLQNNPPGYGGIKVNGEHYGNKYVDMGWIEAVKRVINYVEKENDESSLSPS